MPMSEGADVQDLLLGAIKAKPPPGGKIGPIDPAAMEAFGDLIKTPFVQDTLTKLLPANERAFIRSTPENRYFGSVSPLNPRVVNLRPDSPGWVKEQTLIHELFHTLDFLQRLPPEMYEVVKEEMTAKGVPFDWESVPMAGEKAVQGLRGGWENLSPAEQFIMAWVQSRLDKGK